VLLVVVVEVVVVGSLLSDGHIASYLVQVGNGLPTLATAEQVIAAVKAAGFEVVDYYDANEGVHRLVVSSSSSSSDDSGSGVNQTGQGLVVGGWWGHDDGIHDDDDDDDDDDK